MMKPLRGIWQLTRFKEYVSFVIITTLLGAAAGQGSFSWLLIRVLVANWLAVGFAFMINDVEDAPDDALDPAKVLRNPISAGVLSPRIGRLLSYVVAALAALLYAAVGLGPFIAGLACLILAYLYSWRPIRLKAIPIADLISHAALLAGLQFLTAYLAFGGGPAWQWVFPSSRRESRRPRTDRCGRRRRRRSPARAPCSAGCPPPCRRGSNRLPSRAIASGPD